MINHKDYIWKGHILFEELSIEAENWMKEFIFNFNDDHTTTGLRIEDSVVWMSESKGDVPEPYTRIPTSVSITIMGDPVTICRKILAKFDEQQETQLVCYLDAYTKDEKRAPYRAFWKRIDGKWQTDWYEGEMVPDMTNPKLVQRT